MFVLVLVLFLDRHTNRENLLPRNSIFYKSTHCLAGVSARSADSIFQFSITNSSVQQIQTYVHLLIWIVGLPATEVDNFLLVAEVSAGVIIGHATALGVVPANSVERMRGTTQMRTRVVRQAAAQAVHVTIKAEMRLAAIEVLGAALGVFQFVRADLHN